MIQGIALEFASTYDFELNDLRQRTYDGLSQGADGTLPIDELLGSGDYVEHLVGVHLKCWNDDQTFAAPDDDAHSRSQIDLGRLASRCPMADVADGAIVEAKLQLVSRFHDLLQTEFGHNFIGIVVAGSLAKGYARQESDADLALIGEDRGIGEFGRVHSGGYGVDHFSPIQAYVHCDPGLRPIVFPGETDCLFNPLFQGIFMGDRRRLEAVQANFIDGVSAQEWDEYRKRMVYSEIANKKRQSRLGLTGRQNYELQLMSLLQRVPPAYSEVS